MQASAFDRPIGRDVWIIPPVLHADVSQMIGEDVHDGFRSLAHAGELETGPRGEAGTQIHLIHIQWHDERARPDRAMRPSLILVRLTQVTCTGRSGKLTTGNISLVIMARLIFCFRVNE